MCTNPDLSQTVLHTHTRTDTHAHMLTVCSDDNTLTLTNELSGSYQSSEEQLYNRK